MTPFESAKRWETIANAKGFKIGHVYRTLGGFWRGETRTGHGCTTSVGFSTRALAKAFVRENHAPWAR